VEWGATSVSINRDVIGKVRENIAKVEAELDQGSAEKVPNGKAATLAPAS
jgi:hypothetical protein